ncbi:MAG: VCBS repeat-containing protein [Bacteroidota bacterium]|nr:VCBS repeat-containing protein [Bacteroidota bacterium]
MIQDRRAEVWLKILFIPIILLLGCRDHSSKKKVVAFEVLENSRTGLDFINKLTPTSEFNVFNYMYYYNGGGIGVGDFNNDGLIDVFFAANQTDDKMYLNQGNLKFRDVTAEAQIPEDGGWSTGISVVDINNDGLLDIYICRVGNLEKLQSHNQLLICQGIDKQGVPHYKDEIKEYGLDFSGFSTQALFFDYDLDGDLDMYLLNHSIHQNGTFGPRDKNLATFNPLSGDRLYRNNGNGKFTDVTRESGIHSSIIGYGLGIAASDINLDGYPDLYVGNDFHENDYLYINQHNGTFKDELNDQMMHTSQYTMGVDVADINNDGYPEVMSVDMLPYDPYVLKRSEGESTWDIFNMKLGYGYNYQYTRNNLQLNRRNGHFSEIGLYAGVAATDWTWSPLWFDFDNDGVKDLFISNGIPKRLNDIDFINYASSQEIQERMAISTISKKDRALLDKFPEIKIPNKFFRNNNELKFEDLESEIENDKKTFSNGSVYADFDNDGDLDVLVNNIDAASLLYENKSNDKKDKPYVELVLKGPSQNVNAIGSKIILFANHGIRTYEKFPVRGFLSSMEIPMHIGLVGTQIDSAFLVWPDNSFQAITLKPVNSRITFQYAKGLPKFNYANITGYWKNPTRPMKDITASTGLLHKHEENDFHEFDRELLIPHMISTEGPALVVADFNHDGLDDVFIGSSKWKKSVVFLQNGKGKFSRNSETDLDNDSTYEDVAACTADVNGDGHPDLVVASGGNEFYGKDPMLTPRVYLNDGKGNFSKEPNPFGDLFVNASCVQACDFNRDGYPDLFIGGRSVPWAYGQIPQSYLLQNDGHGKFINVTDRYAGDLGHIGFVTQACWFDLDKNGDPDLLVSLEWGGLIAYMNNRGVFTKKILSDKKGWWNFLLPCDIDGDGDIDLIAGNLGLNSRLKASAGEPVKLYYNDFDKNGTKEQILTYYLGGNEIPFATKDELQKQLPNLRKKYLYAADFAKASLNEIFGEENLKNSVVLQADYFANAVLINDGKMNFSTQALPWQAQLTSYRDALVIDANHDSLPDILLVGNYYDNNIQMGRYDADYGTILLNKGGGKFSVESINGLQIKGQVRHIRGLTIQKKQAYVLVRNNDSTMVIQ